MPGTKQSTTLTITEAFINEDNQVTSTWRYNVIQTPDGSIIINDQVRDKLIHFENIDCLIPLYGNTILKVVDFSDKKDLEHKEEGYIQRFIKRLLIKLENYNTQVNESLKREQQKQSVQDFTGTDRFLEGESYAIYHIKDLIKELRK